MCNNRWSPCFSSKGKKKTSVFVYTGRKRTIRVKSGLECPGNGGKISSSGEIQLLITKANFSVRFSSNVIAIASVNWILEIFHVTSFSSFSHFFTSFLSSALVVLQFLRVSHLHSLVIKSMYILCIYLI